MNDKLPKRYTMDHLGSYIYAHFVFITFTTQLIINKINQIKIVWGSSRGLRRRAFSFFARHYLSIQRIRCTHVAAMFSEQYWQGACSIDVSTLFSDMIHISNEKEERRRRRRNRYVARRSVQSSSPMNRAINLFVHLRTDSTENVVVDVCVRASVRIRAMENARAIDKQCANARARRTRCPLDSISLFVFRENVSQNERGP